MLLKSDVMNPYSSEAVTVKEAVKESFRIASLGYESPEQYTHMCVDHLADMFGTLLENLNDRGSLGERTIVKILNTHTITTSQE